MSHIPLSPGPSGEDVFTSDEMDIIDPATSQSTYESHCRLASDTALHEDQCASAGLDVLLAALLVRRSKNSSCQDVTDSTA